MIGIVRSEADEASEHIVEHLLELAEWEECVDESVPDSEGGGTYYRTDGAELRSFADLHLHLEDAAAPFDGIDWLAFASRHSGDTGPLLTAHPTGNFGPAEYGGEDGQFAEAAPAALSAVVEGFEEHAPPEYGVGIECTHHGPSSVGVPSLFVELGSEPDQWSDPAGAQAVAAAILDARDAPGHAAEVGGHRRQVVGIGGGHYAPRFARIVRDTDWHVGHVAADWCLDALGDPTENRDIIDRVFQQSEADLAVVDGDHPDVVDAVESLGYRIVSETFLRETDGIDLDLVAHVEDALRPVDEGTRFGDRALEHAGEVLVEPLPTDVIDETRRIDDAATRTTVEAHTVGFETEQSGTRIGDRAAFADRDDRSTLVDALLDVLAREYEVVRDGDAVEITETAFDPDLAADRGVPEGPKFGKLSSGQPVTVDGEQIDPEEVTREQVRTLQL